MNYNRFKVGFVKNNRMPAIVVACVHTFVEGIIFHPGLMQRNDSVSVTRKYMGQRTCLGACQLRYVTASLHACSHH